MDTKKTQKHYFIFISIFISVAGLIGLGVYFGIFHVSDPCWGCSMGKAPKSSTNPIDLGTVESECPNGVAGYSLPPICV